MTTAIAALSDSTIRAQNNGVPIAEETQRFLLNDISWEGYTKLGEVLQDRPGLRMTYDRGTLELMVMSPMHEILKTRLGRLLETLTEEHGLPYFPGGNMTMQRDDLLRGLEGDECYWIAQELRMRGKLTWSAQKDPPPDVVVEIEISRSALNKLAIYAALGVPEVWRFDGETLRVELLQPDGKYTLTERSPTFPSIPLQGIVPFVMPDAERSYSGMLDEFREWIRRHLAAQG